MDIAPKTSRTERRPCSEALAAALHHATEAHTKVAASVGDLSRVLDEMVPRVVGQETVMLDENGSFSRQFRVPFRSIFVDSLSQAILTVTNGTPQSEAPGAGPGIAFVRAGGSAVINFRSYQWSIYGGAAGELVTVTAFGNPQPPFTN